MSWDEFVWQVIFSSFLVYAGSLAVRRGWLGYNDATNRMIDDDRRLRIMYPDADLMSDPSFREDLDDSQGEILLMILGLIMVIIGISLILAAINSFW